MYRVLVVDDEPLMRTFLAKKIPEFAEQFEVCGMAQDGQEAIDFLQEHPGEVDVVITDIKMPEVDGLALAKHVSTLYPDTVTIIISGYSDFEYARKAIQYNVSDYLLKPLQDQNLTEALQTVALRLVGRTMESRFYVSPNSLPGDSLKRELIRAILDGDTAQVYKTYEELGGCGHLIMGAAGCIARCRLLYTSPAPDNEQLMESSFYTLNILANELCGVMGLTCLYGKNGDSYILIDGATPAELENKASVLYQVMSASTKVTAPIDLYCGKIVTDVMHLPQSMDSLSVFWPSSITVPSGLLSCSNAPHKSDVEKGIERECSQILADIEEHHREELLVDIRRLCQDYLNFNPRCLWRIGEYLINSVESLTADTRQAMKQEAYSVLSGACTNQRLTESEHGQYSDALWRTLSVFVPRKARAREQEMPTIRKARGFILEHYQASISLQDVAEHCNVSSSYLSDLFHKQLGVSYSKYIVKLRMEQASKLLRNYPEMKVYEVAEKTGFTSAKHFISVFKKYYGISPSQFQKKV